MVHLQALGTFIATHPVALLLCVIAYMAIGSVWYGPLFSKPWAKMTGMDKMDQATMKKMMVPAMTTSVVTGFVQAVVLGRGMEILAMSSWIDPLVIVTILWLPFTALVLAQGYAYTHKPFKLLAIDAGYILIGLWAMSLILYKALA